MSLPPAHLPPPPSDGKRPISTEERRVMDAERAKALSLRVLLEQELELRGVRDPAEIGAVVGVSAIEAEQLLTRRRWRAGDLALLETMATRLGMQVSPAEAG